MVRGRGQWQQQLSSVRALTFQVEGEELVHSTAVATPPHVFLLSGGAGGVREAAAAWRSQEQETGEEGGGGGWRQLWEMEEDYSLHRPPTGRSSAVSSRLLPDRNAVIVAMATPCIQS